MRPKPPHLVLALAALLSLPLAAEEAKEKPAGTPAAPAAPAMKAHIDPATGQFLSEPDPSTPSRRAATSAGSLPRLKVEKVTTSAGGKKIRLDERFLMEMTARATPDGGSSVTCRETRGAAATGTEEHRHDR